jgi:hypothetical protein
MKVEITNKDEKILLIKTPSKEHITLLTGESASVIVGKEIPVALYEVEND